MRRRLGLVLALVLVTHGYGLSAEERTYYAEGRNADGNPYTATVQFTASGERVGLRWSFPEGGEAIGYGFVHGDLLVVTFALVRMGPNGPQQSMPGVALYRRLEDGTWEGQWLIGSTPVLRETLHTKPQTARPTGREIQG